MNRIQLVYYFHIVILVWIIAAIASDRVLGEFGKRLINRSTLTLPLIWTGFMVYASKDYNKCNF